MFLRDNHSFKPTRTSESGFSLVEAIVALSIITVVVGALLTVLHVSTTERLRDVFVSDANSLASLLAETLATPAQCQTALETTSLTVANRRELSSNVTAQPISDAVVVGGIALQDQVLGRARFEKAALTLQNSLHGNAYTALLSVSFQPLHASDQIRSIVRYIPLQVDMVDANPTTLIQSCNAKSNVFSGGASAPIIAGVTCNPGQVLSGINTEGTPICESIFDLLPPANCQAGEFIGINPATQSLFCINAAGATSSAQVRGPGCRGNGCTARDGGPCYGNSCVTNGNFCDGNGCSANDTWPTTAGRRDWQY